MQITLYSKKVKAESGKQFNIYLSRLPLKTGDEMSARVMFEEGCPAPKPDACPMNIIVDKSDAHLQSKRYTDKAGIEQISQTLWVSAWTEGEPYEDHSMDVFVD